MQRKTHCRFQQWVGLRGGSLWSDPKLLEVSSRFVEALLGMMPSMGSFGFVVGIEDPSVRCLLVPE